MYPLFDKFFSRENQDVNNRYIEEENPLLYTIGQGRNTYSVHFSGWDDEGNPVAFIYHLNISAIRFGLRYMRIFDTVLSISFSDKAYLFGRDMGEIKRNKFRFDELVFESNYSRLKGDLNLLDLTAYIPDGGVDVAMDFVDGKKRTCTLDTIESQNHFFAIGMDCQGMVQVHGETYNIRGTATVEKKYKEIPKGRVKKAEERKLKINFMSDEEDGRFFSLMSKINDSTGEEQTQLFSVGNDGTIVNEEFESSMLIVEGEWISEETDMIYSLPLKLESPRINLAISTDGYKDAQEVYSKNKNNRMGVYMGGGRFEGNYIGTELKGACVIEMSGSY